MLFLAMAFASTKKLAAAKKWLLESEKLIWPPALTSSQQVFRESWFGAEAAILSDEVQQIASHRFRPSL